MNDRTEVAIVAAMHREIAPLVSGWEIILGPHYRFYEHGNVIAFCGGIGPEAARVAAETVLTFRQPSLIISAGFAGALRETLPVGTVIVPTKVLGATSEQTFRIEGGGEGTLVSVDSIVDSAVKRDLAAKYTADAVDMEAAAVAGVAQARGVRFVAVKAVSDSARFELPPMSHFIDADGEFQTMRFVAHAAFRPVLWPALSTLKRNADKAANALCACLARIQCAADVDQLFMGARAS